MAYSSPSTHGYGPDSTIAALVREGFSSLPVPQSSLSTQGYGAGATIAAICTEGYSNLAGLPITLPSTKQAVVVAGLPWVPPARSILEDAVPAVRNGNIIICDKVSSGGYPITMNPDGTFSIATATDTTRQAFTSDVYITETGTYYGEFTTWVNNRLPIQTAPLVLDSLVQDVPMTPVNLFSVLTEPEGDAMTIALAPTSPPLPTGLTLLSGVLSGTPTSPTSPSLVFRVTDITGDFTDMGVDLGVIGSRRYYAIDIAAGSYKVVETDTLPSVAFAVSIDLGAIAGIDRPRVLNTLRALRYYVLFDTWPPV